MMLSVGYTLFLLNVRVGLISVFSAWFAQGVKCYFPNMSLLVVHIALLVTMGPSLTDHRLCSQMVRATGVPHCGVALRVTEVRTSKGRANDNLPRVTWVSFGSNGLEVFRKPRRRWTLGRLYYAGTVSSTPFWHFLALHAHTSYCTNPGAYLSLTCWTLTPPNNCYITSTFFARLLLTTLHCTLVDPHQSAPAVWWTLKPKDLQHVFCAEK